MRLDIAALTESYNLFQRKMENAINHSEALMSNISSTIRSQQSQNSLENIKEELNKTMLTVMNISSTVDRIERDMRLDMEEMNLTLSTLKTSYKLLRDEMNNTVHENKIIMADYRIDFRHEMDKIRSYINTSTSQNVFEDMDSYFYTGTHDTNWWNIFVSWTGWISYYGIKFVGQAISAFFLCMYVTQDDENISGALVLVILPYSVMEFTYFYSSDSTDWFISFVWMSLCVAIGSLIRQMLSGWGNEMQRDAAAFILAQFYSWYWYFWKSDDKLFIAAGCIWFIVCSFAPAPYQYGTTDRKEISGVCAGLAFFNLFIFFFL